MKKIFLFILLGIIANSCGDDDDKVEKQIDLSDTYLPLAVGNEWQYKNYISDTVSYADVFGLKIVDKIIKNEKEYFQLQFNFRWQNLYITY